MRRTPNAYLREDHVLPHLPALLLRLTGQLTDTHGDTPPARITGATPPAAVDTVAHLRSEAISLTYAPATRTLTTDTPQTERITIS